MFGFLKRKTENKIYAPVKGVCLSLSEVNDQVFSSKMMGEGVAFRFDGDEIYAPCSGEVILIASTKHALGIRTENGTEVLLHIGLETVNLQGQGFEVLVQAHDKVKVHQPLVSIDGQLMDEQKIDLILPMVITNTNDYEIRVYDETQTVNCNSIVMETMKR